MSEDHSDFRRISVAVVLMLAFAVLAFVLRDAGYRSVGLVLMAGCIASFVYTLKVFSQFLQRHARQNDDS